MASPAVMAHVNGVAAPPSRPASPASVNSTSTKRKRDATDDSDTLLPDAPSSPKPLVNGVHPSPDSKSLVADFVRVLESHDTNEPSILRRRLLEPPSEGEPSSKRAKSEDPGSKPVSIADKVSQGLYDSLDDLMSDILRATDAQVKELEAVSASSNAGLISKTIAFRNTALDFFRRETAYPNVPRPASRNALSSSGSERYVLTTVGAAPTVRPLFTSLQKDPGKDITDAPLPKGVTLSKIPSEAPVSTERSGRVPTLGELFPSPRNLPPLQPPKAPRTTTKSNVLTFYHPELTDKSTYRQGTYFTSEVSTGHWLDYSHATPTIHPKAKQRERAQSLAGVKPSSTELEMAELETLFRGAFSSFAPCKDDTGAIVPSGQVSRLWWQRVGCRAFNKLVEAEEAEDEAAEMSADAAPTMEVDEEQIKEVIDNWDPSLVDPELVLPKKSEKSEHEKEVDDLLEEVSDLIETLASYQRNRNLTLPTSQDRYSADPVNGDMLRNGNLAHQPTEEEMQTYEALKAQLALIIQNLPPYAVARLNSDRLADLAVSTKIEIRSDEYRGVMEEDEPARLARMAAQAAAANTQRQAHRAPAPSPYVNQQYQQFTPSARPVGPAQHFPQTPSRPQGNMYARAPASVPMPQAHHQPVQPRPVQGTQFRQMYTPQVPKGQVPYGHPNMPPAQYSPAPPQARMQPNYNVVQPGTPTHHRFAPGYAPGYPQHQQIQPHSGHGQPSPMPQHPPHPPPMGHPQPPYAPYPNGAPMSRTMSPQVPQAHPYVPSPGPPQGPPQQPMARPPPGYGAPGPGMPPNAVPRQPYVASPGPGMVMQPGAPPVSAPPPRGPGTPNLTGYATVMPEMQQRQVMEQAQAQAAAAAQQQQQQQQQQQGAMKPVVGLAGIGLAGHMDVHKVAAAKMQQQQQQALQQQLQAQQQAQQQHMGNHMGGQGQRIAPAVNGAVNSPRPIQAAPAPSPSPVPVPVPVAQPPGQTPQAVGGQGGQ
ncbi:hypothetical protein VTJ04DRAFT_7106 [Mycothermus thermophilus]|uniref:uncharacterized protein n=1 Tax=Humicola insolens TaxID=85995 RepID=UPI003743B5F6